MCNAICRYLGAFGRSVAVETVECHKRRAQNIAGCDCLGQGILTKIVLGWDFAKLGYGSPTTVVKNWRNSCVYIYIFIYL